MNILFSGCSWTFGSELEDHEKSRFSRLVCDRIGATEINVAKRGCANEVVCKNTFDYLNSTDDHPLQVCPTRRFTRNNLPVDFVFIQITSCVRHSIVHRKAITTLNPMGGINGTLTSMARLLFKKDDIEKWFQLTRWKVCMLDEYLTMKNIPHVFVAMNGFEADRLKPYLGENIHPISLYEVCINNNVKMGKDKHPLEKGHQVIAEEVILPYVL